jgi:hypothetical protein
MQNISIASIEIIDLRVGLMDWLNYHHLVYFWVVVREGSRLAKQLWLGFPETLEGAPMLLPAGNTWSRRALDQWFESQDTRPQVVA